MSGISSGSGIGPGGVWAEAWLWDEGERVELPPSASFPVDLNDRDDVLLYCSHPAHERPTTPNETWQSDFTHYRLTRPDGSAGELLRELTINPNHDYHGTRAPKGPTRPPQK